MEEEIILGRKDHSGLVTDKIYNPLLSILPSSNELEATEYHTTDRNY